LDVTVDHRETSRIDSYAQAQAIAAAASPHEVQIRFLQRTTAFRQLPRQLLEQMAGALQQRSFTAGDVIVREGDAASEFCIIETGTVSVRTVIGQTEHELARLGPGESFGEVALLGGGFRTASVYAATPVRISVLTREQFDYVLAQVPEFAATISEIARLRDRAVINEQERQDLAALLQQKSEIRIGRELDNDIVIAKPYVSRYHATVRADGDTFRLIDSSSAGTFVNGAAVRGAVALRDGDEIVIGDERFIFDRQGTVRVVESGGIRIDAINVTRTVKSGKTLLHDICLSILPGDFVAIVGGSGAGKTTFMDALSGVQPATSGQILYNGRDYYRNIESYRTTVGYVPQDDIIHKELDLRRTFRHAARLRLPRDTTKAGIDEAVDTTFDELQLTERASVRVGALSGGQRKRASIGIELLTKPRVFYLDEPTSGLDPATETQIMRMLRGLADGGRTIILTTHATKNVMMCDRIIVLARDGHLAFVGPPADALRYFDVETFDDIYERLAEDATPEEWGERFRASPDYQQLLLEQQAPAQLSLEDGKRSKPKRRSRLAAFHEWKVLSQRNFDLYTRFPSNLGQVFGQPVVFTILLLALFSSGLFEPTFDNPTAPLQLVFLMAFNAFLIGLLSSVQEIIKEIPIFFRERNVGVGVTTYLCSKMSFLVPVIIVGNLIMLAILKVTNRLPAGGMSMLGPLFVSLFLAGTAGMALGLLTSAFVRSSQQGTDLLSLWIMPQVLFSGALFAVGAMNAVGAAISNIALVRWAFEASGNAVDLTGVFRENRSVTGRSLLEQYGTSFSDGPTKQWIIMIVFTIVPLVLTAIILRTRQPQR
jgi:ABC-type multidrug transport system ATPase subunit/CRP-like cAMP-binding protein